MFESGLVFCLQVGQSSHGGPGVRVRPDQAGAFLYDTISKMFLLFSPHPTIEVMLVTWSGNSAE